MRRLNARLVTVAFAAVLAWNAVADRRPTQAAEASPPSSVPSGCHVRGRGLFVLPDPSCTPGAINSAVTQDSIGQTICRAGWARTVRPPESVTEREKHDLVQAYGYYAGHRLGAYELDHFVPIELGGAPDGQRNLWPEVDPRGASRRSFYLNPKDRLERTLNRRVCSGQMSLAQARQLISTDWVTAYRRYVK